MRRARVTATAVGALAVSGVGFSWATLQLPQFGARAAGDRLARMQASPHFADGRAQSPEPTSLGMNGAYVDVLKEYVAGGQEPEVPLPVIRPDLPDAPRADGVQVTWLGHSTLLVEVDGRRILTDPVFSERASPFPWAGPARFHRVPLELEELPRLDAVVLSHDHYDHLDMGSIRRLAALDVPFFVPLGVGAHLESWGIPPERITELDWWEEAMVGDLRLVCTPARHFSGRGPLDRNATLWASWAFVGPAHRAWFSGDTGPFEAAAEIGRRLGPFDLSMIEIGAWHPAWGTVHLGPDEAERMHRQVGARTLLPVHWGTFNLATHAWDQPIVRLQAIAAETGTPLVVPVAGQTVRPETPFVAEFWRERAARARGAVAPLAVGG